MCNSLELEFERLSMIEVILIDLFAVLYHSLFAYVGWHLATVKLSQKLIGDSSSGCLDGPQTS